MRTTDVGLLILRTGAGLSIAVGHGWGKAMRLVEGNTSFADPIGIGELPSLVLATFAELVCALLVVVGLRTRWAALPVVVTMAVAAFLQHAGDPFGKRELAVVYGVVFLALAFTGGGRYSIDKR